MSYKIHSTVVIGAGTMGAAIAAHLANAGIRVILLDIVPNSLNPAEQKAGLNLKDPLVRNRIVREGLQRALKSRPASFFTPETASLVTVGNLEDDFAVVGEADWVIEAIVENLEIKRQLMARLDAARGPHTIVSTNTSGIPVTAIAQGRSQEFRRYFLGTHFFNPPRYLKLVEVIPIAETLPGVVDFISHFLEFRLGKGVVQAKDTPNFIANRLGFASGAYALDYILCNDYSVEEVDAITGPVLGRPKTATFRLMDLVGLDVWEHVGRNLAPAIPEDEQAQRYLGSQPANELIHTMVERGWLGGKTRQGFYKEVRLAEDGKEFWPLNLKTVEYQPPVKVRFDSIGKAKDVADLGTRLKMILEAGDRAGQLARALTYQSLAYASARIPEIADTPLPVDDAIRWGFGHAAGPFETWDMLGVAETSEAMRSAGFAPAAWVEAMIASGHPTFYQYEGSNKRGVYAPALGEYTPIRQSPALLRYNDSQEIARNPSASLYDLGEGVAGMEIHSKANALDDDIFNLLTQALDQVEDHFEGLVIGTQSENFSAGANLFMVVMAAQNNMWEALGESVRKLQDINMRMRYFPKPVVAAVTGLALGGGAEVLMHCSRVVAGAELYAGQVEFGAGVIPAGGGTKELLRRILNPPMRTQNAGDLPFLQRVFEQIGLGKVSTSAEEARAMSMLSPSDRVVMNRDHLLMEARREVLEMVAGGYRPPLPEKIYAAGREALAALRVAIFMLKEGRSITEHEAVMAGKLAEVMTGGALSRPGWVAEQTILDLEREAFLSLCGMEKTQQRMWNLLQTGKVLRN